MRQPYGRDIASTVVYAHPVWFARHGYNVVIQDVRGRGDSEGEFYPFRNEGRDGAETIAWLRTRPESNGRIGMYGFSYQGMTQLLAAAEQPEGLRLHRAGHDRSRSLPRLVLSSRRAAIRHPALGWGIQMLKGDARRLKLREASDRLEQAWANLASQTGVLPFRAHPAIQGEGVPSYVLDWFDHDEPGEYWSSLDVSRSVHKIGVPALHVSGWYDMFLHGSIDGFRRPHRTRGQLASRASNQYLIAGPWLHIPWGDRIGAADFGAEALLDTDAILLRWFNHWLKDSGEFAAEPKIRHFVLGENRWREAHAWPRPREARASICTAAAKQIRAREMASFPPPRRAPKSPATYSSTIPKCRFSAPGGPAAQAGQFDQAALEMGNNVLVYTSEAARRAAPRFRHAARCSLLLHVFRAHRLHRQTRSRKAQRRGGIHLHRHRAFQLAFRGIGLRRGQNSSLGIRSRADVVSFRGGRTHSPGNRRQRFPALRSQSRNGSAFVPRHFLGLAALDADSCFTTRSAPPPSICR